MGVHIQLYPASNMPSIICREREDTGEREGAMKKHIISET